MPVDVGVLRDADVGARPVELTVGAGPDDEFNFAMPAYDATDEGNDERKVLGGTAGRLTSFRSLTFRGRWLLRRRCLLDLLLLLLLLIVHGATVGLLLIFLSILMRCWPRARLRVRGSCVLLKMRLTDSNITS